MKPKYNTAKFRSQTLGASLVTSIVVCLSGSAFAADNFWTGTTSADWNDVTNWSLGRVPEKDTFVDNAVINTNTGNIATITANIAKVPQDILIGLNGSTNGRLDHRAGTASTGSGNWMLVGRQGGIGVYNLADTSVVDGGNITGFGQGSGTINVGGEFQIGSQTGGQGTVNVNTTGSLNVPWNFFVGRSDNGGGCTAALNLVSGNVNGNSQFIIGEQSTGTVTVNGGKIFGGNEFWVGQGGDGNGTLTLNAGEITSNNWVAIGREGGNGTVNHTGGTWTKTGGGVFIIADNTSGIYHLSGTGVLTATELWVGQGGGGNGTLNIGVGTTVNVSGWTVFGRDNGTGLVNMTGGSITKTGGGQFIVGANATGTMNMSGGLVDVQGGFTWVGEGNNRPAILNISGTADFRTSTMSVGQNTNGTLNLDGGTIRTQRFIGSREADDTGDSGGNGTINFNGAQVIATANNTLNFISTTVDNAVIGTGGLLLNSNGFNLVVPKGLSGTGGLVKSGSGALTLSGVSSYGGNNSVNAGKLTLNCDSSGTGGITLADGTALGLVQVNPANSLDPANVTFGTSGATTLDINLGNFSGNPSAAPLNVSGTLTLNGTVTVNVTDQFPAIGSIPLVSYVGPKAGAGSFVLGTLPEGVTAVLNDDGTGLVSLVVSNATLPKWDGTDAPKYAKTAALASGSFDVVVTNDTSIAIGQKVFGAGIPAGASVTAISGMTITLDQAATATAAAAPLVFTTGVGSNDGVWDISTTDNWINQISGANSDFPDPDFPALFDDSATGPTSVVLDATVAPSSVTFANSTLPYSLSGTGKITGITGVTKSGTAALSVSTANDYTGITRLDGGTTTVGTLTNGGVASPLGAASADASNLALSGGTLAYTGGAVTIDRGLSVAATGSGVVSALNLSDNVTTSGQIAASLGKLHKTGPGTLTLSGTGANVLANGNGDEAVRAFSVVEGGVVLNGTGQTNTVTGRIGVGTNAGATASLALANGASLTVNGWTNFSPVANANTSLTISDTSAYQANDVVQFGLGAGSVTNIVIEDSGSFNKGSGGWFSIGNSSTAAATMTIRDSGSLTTAGGDLNIGDVDSANGTLILEDDASVTSAGFVFIGKNSTHGTLTMSGTSSMSCPETDVGYGNPSVGVLTIGRLGVLADTPVYTQTGRLLVGRDGGSLGTLTIQGDGSMTVGSYTSVGMNGHGDMLIKDSGSFSNTDDFSINENGDAPSSVTVLNAGELTVAPGGHTFYVGRNDNRVGTLTIDDTATVTAVGTGGVRLANGAGSVGTVNLDGGTLTIKKASAGSGNSTVKLNGGVLKAASGADLNFMSGITTVDVYGGGAFIDTNGETIAIGQSLGDQGGDLTKQGAGTLLLNGNNGYLGTTTVALGTLGGNGSVAGPLVVASGASVNPGASAGTFSVGDSATIGGTYVCEIDGANSDTLAVAGALDITGATLDFNVLATPTSQSYVLASYTSLVGNPAIEVDVPAGFHVEYGATEMLLVLTPTPYSDWANTYGLNPLTDGAPGADADGDGQNNSVEFALGGSPTSGSDNAKVFNLAADSDADGDSTNELLLTIAVRTGTPAFIGSPSPAATKDGFTYTIEGSTTLSSFTTTATPVTTVAPPAPNATPPTDYEYRTFSLSGSNGLPDKGFLRVKVTN